MNIKSWILPIRSAPKQPVQSKATPPVKPSFEKFATEDDRRFERGYN
jgi:hypothetical protein